MKQSKTEPIPALPQQEEPVTELYEVDMESYKRGFDACLQMQKDKPYLFSAPIAPLLGQDEPELPSLPKKVRGEDWAKYWGRAFDERTKQLTQALTSLAAEREKNIHYFHKIERLDDQVTELEASLAADSQKEDKGCDWEDNERAYRAGSKIDEASLAEAQKEIRILNGTLRGYSD